MSWPAQMPARRSDGGGASTASRRQRNSRTTPGDDFRRQHASLPCQMPSPSQRHNQLQPRASERQNARDARRPLLALDAAVAAVAVAPAQRRRRVLKLTAAAAARRLRAPHKRTRAAVARRPPAVLESTRTAAATDVLAVPVGAGPAVAVELAVAVDRSVVEVALALGEGEQGEQGYSSSSSVGRHLYASGTELCYECAPGLPRSKCLLVSLRPLADYVKLVPRV